METGFVSADTEYFGISARTGWEPAAFSFHPSCDLWLISQEGFLVIPGRSTVDHAHSFPSSGRTLASVFGGVLMKNCRVVYFLIMLDNIVLRPRVE